MEGPEVGSQIVTSSGVIGDSGLAVAVYGVQWTSGSTAGNLTLKNGTGASGPALIGPLAGTISTNVMNPLVNAGIVFPLGCFASFDANVTTATIYYRQIKTA